MLYQGMIEVFISLGSNQGIWKDIQTRALLEIEERVGRLVQQSQVYQTEPWGRKDQPTFKNQVIQLSTTLPPMDVLQQLLQIEKQLGRDREKEERWGPRTLDLDILYYGNEEHTLQHLEIPHPRMHRRKFILIPLNEIATERLHPVLNKTTEQLLQDCLDESQVEPYFA